MKREATNFWDNAINFIVPEANQDQRAEILEFIKSQLKRKDKDGGHPIQICILWGRNTHFMQLLRKMGLNKDFGRKEVIVQPTHILATNDYRIVPSLLCERRH